MLLKIINMRMEKKIEEEIADEQAGFREGRELVPKPQIPPFIDYSKALMCIPSAAVAK